MINGGTKWIEAINRGRPFNLQNIQVSGLVTGTPSEDVTVNQGEVFVLGASNPCSSSCHFGTVSVGTGTIVIPLFIFFFLLFFFCKGFFFCFRAHFGFVGIQTRLIFVCVFLMLHCDG